MDLPPSSPSLPILSVDDYDLDFLNAISDPNFTATHSPLGNIGSPSNALVSAPINPAAQVDPPSMLAPSVDSVINSAGRLGSGSMDQLAIGDQIPLSNINNQTFPIGDRPMQTFVNQISQPTNPQELSFPTNINPYLNPDHELPPTAYFQRLLMGQFPIDHDELLPQANYSNQAPIHNFAMNHVALGQSSSQTAMSAFESQFPCDNNYINNYKNILLPPYNPVMAWSSANNFASSVGEIMNHDPVGVACFLAGVVRPCGETQIFKCSVCFCEFPNAQAFGGHMKAHAKRKMEEGEEVVERRHKAKKARSARKAKASSGSGSCSSKNKKTNGSKRKDCESSNEN